MICTALLKRLVAKGTLSHAMWMESESIEVLRATVKSNTNTKHNKRKHMHVQTNQNKNRSIKPIQSTKQLTTKQTHQQNTHEQTDRQTHIDKQTNHTHTRTDKQWNRILLWPTRGCSARCLCATLNIGKQQVLKSRCPRLMSVTVVSVRTRGFGPDILVFKSSNPGPCSTL